MIIRAALLVGILVSLGASHRTSNFIVSAPTAEVAREMALAAEQYRYHLAVQWLGRPLVDWDEPCPINVVVGDHLRSSGETSFVFRDGRPAAWRMWVAGSRRSVRQSVLPHEVTHTIFASHFGRPLPRWAEEGACVTAEDIRDRRALAVGVRSEPGHHRTLALHSIFSLREYPHDVTGFYAQGYSLVRFLLERGGRQKFIQFLDDGMNTQNWLIATEKHYGYGSLIALQTEWLAWEATPRFLSPS